MYNDILITGDLAITTMLRILFLVQPALKVKYEHVTDK